VACEKDARKSSCGEVIPIAEIKDGIPSKHDSLPEINDKHILYYAGLPQSF
jgi:hypothetical protein